jgi:hypothetical protein
MSVGPFLRRELATSVRSSRAFADRRGSLLLVAGLVLGCLVVWDWQGWDRASVAGGQWVGLAMFLLVIFAMGAMGVGMVVPNVASAIASERDHKTLDALLASRFSSAEIVLGAIASGLFRYANAMLTMLPVAVLVVFLGGVPPVWVVLAALGLGSMAILLASVAVVASVHAKSGARAMNLAALPFLLWVMLPTFFILFRPLIWPGAPSWLVSIVLPMIDGSPLGLVINLGGLIPRPGGPLAAVERMVAWQLSLSLALLTWAIVRLRPASRGLYDLEGEATRIKKLRAAMRRPPRRPPCYDDPVLWYEIHSTVGLTAFWRRIGQTITLLMLGCMAWVIWGFASPAFSELLERGYRTSPEAFRLPDVEPLARFLIGKIYSSLAMSATPGQARLEFNVILREFSAIFVMASTFMAFQSAFESVKKEQKRDTWLGLIATPLSGWEILRGKTLGSLWKTMGGNSTLLALWTLGLLTGAVHPLGFLAGVLFMVASTAFFAAYGFSMALATSNPEFPPKLSAFSIIQLPILLVVGAILTIAPMLLAWASLFSFEDVHAVVHASPYPQFHGRSLEKILGARSVAALWLLGTVGFAVGAVWQTRANVREFDKSIGRPVRPELPVAAQDPAEAAPPVVSRV